MLSFDYYYHHYIVWNITARTKYRMETHFFLFSFFSFNEYFTLSYHKLFLHNSIIYYYIMFMCVIVKNIVHPRNKHVSSPPVRWPSIRII